MEIIGRVSPKGAGTAQTYILLDVKATSTPHTNTLPEYTPPVLSSMVMRMNTAQNYPFQADLLAGTEKVCMYIHIHIHTHTCMYIHVYIHLCASMVQCTLLVLSSMVMRMDTAQNYPISIREDIYIYIYVYIHANVNIRVTHTRRTHVCMYVYVFLYRSSEFAACYTCMTRTQIDVYMCILCVCLCVCK